MKYTIVRMVCDSHRSRCPDQAACDVHMRYAYVCIRIAGKFSVENVWRIYSFQAFVEKVWRMNRSVKGLLIVNTILWTVLVW